MANDSKIYSSLLAAVVHRVSHYRHSAQYDRASQGDEFPPTQWFLGRIVELYPGKDGIVQVVSVSVV
jgi:hypothetical protein